MLVYIISKSGKPLMPCVPVVARLLLKEGKAKVKDNMPFTLQLSIDSTEYTQAVIAGMDTGSKTVGCAAIANSKVIYQAEISLRDDVSKKLKRRAMYRGTRRGRKTRYRPARWLNRAASKKEGRLAPSLISKIASHLREKKQVEAILPVSVWKVETASFDIHQITNPDVQGHGYQDGNQKGYYNVKAYILHRDHYRCQSKRKIKHHPILEIHHIIFRSAGGTDTPSNLLTLCQQCHADLHQGKLTLKAKRSKTKHATEMGIIKSQLKKQWVFEETFGYETKFKREQILQQSKSHANDAIAICCEDDEWVTQNTWLFYKKHVASGDYQQIKGSHSEKKIPTGKLFGLRKYDLIKTQKGIGFIKGKRSSGYFSLSTIHGKTLHASASVKKNTVRLAARSTTLTNGVTLSSSS